MIRDQTIDPIPLELDAYLVICDSGIKGQTSQAIATVKEKLQATPTATKNMIAAMRGFKLASTQAISTK